MGYAVKLQGGSNLKMNFDPNGGTSYGYESNANYGMPKMHPGIYDILVLTNLSTGGCIKYRRGNSFTTTTPNVIVNISSPLAVCYCWLQNIEIINPSFGTNVSFQTTYSGYEFRAIAFPHSKKLTIDVQDTASTSDPVTIRSGKLEAVYVLGNTMSLSRFVHNRSGTTTVYSFGYVGNSYTPVDYCVTFSKAVSGGAMQYVNFTKYVNAGDTIRAQYAHAPVIQIYKDES